jgi:exostosin family protein
MARVLLLSATPEDDQTDFNLAPLQEALKCAELDRFHLHSLTANPETADLIVFVEFYGSGWYFRRVRRHPLVRRYREKCFLFSANPLVIPLLPGVYTGVEKRWASERTRPGFYFGRSTNKFTDHTPPAHDLPFLFSFMGSVRNADVRARLLTLSHPRSVFQNTTADFDRILRKKMDRFEALDYERRYAELIKATKFVLCPRGVSASSIRLFETMRMGRVPVILSDGWVPPAGPRWDKFSLRVRERDFTRVPALLEKREPEAVNMGSLARTEWERWFSEEVLFHQLVELCLDIRAKRKLPESWSRWAAYSQFLEPFHFRRVLGTIYRRLRETASRAAGQPADCKQQW